MNRRRLTAILQRREPVRAAERMSRFIWTNSAALDLNVPLKSFIDIDLDPFMILVFDSGLEL